MSVSTGSESVSYKFGVRLPAGFYSEGVMSAEAGTQLPGTLLQHKCKILIKIIISSRAEVQKENSDQYPENKISM